MHYAITLLQIAAVYALALISPGPNFLMVTQLSLAGRRSHGVASAIGVGFGSAVWATLAMLGFAAVLQRIDWLYDGVRIGGALYLAWLGIKLLCSGARADRSAAAAATQAAPATESAPARQLAAGRDAHLRTWRTGLFTCLTSPKSCVFWTSVFAAMLPARAPGWFFAVTLVTIAAMSFGWHCGIAFLFADDRTQRGYRRLRRPIDAFCGAALVGLGVKLIADR
jgi:threonine/homoserine/homoserine lactone efflux protein